VTREHATFGFVIALVTGTAAAAGGQVNDAAMSECRTPMRETITHLAMPGSPFQPVATADGCYIFVSLPRTDAGASGGVALVRRSHGAVSLVRVIPTDASPTGIVLTHDGKWLIAAAGATIVILDVPRMIVGASDAVRGSLTLDDGAGAIYANVTADDRYLFVSLERAQSIAVVDLVKLHAGAKADSALVGLIPVGNAPIALTFSPDERYLYTTSQAAPPRLGWPVACKPEGANQATAVPNHPKGAVFIVDVGKATTNPTTSVVGAVAAGCNPVRLVLSPSGDRAYVTARNSNALLVFDTPKLLSDSANALIATVPVGTAPVGVAVIDSGRKIVVTNSNRFGGSADDHQDLTLIDAGKITAGAGAVIGTIPAGAFPRELSLTKDGRTLLLTNFASKTLQLVDVERVMNERR
jgi:YVTN family beta-propeller protein